jgi:hypothetical protein
VNETPKDCHGVSRAIHGLLLAANGPDPSTCHQSHGWRDAPDRTFGRGTPARAPSSGSALTPHSSRSLGRVGNRSVLLPSAAKEGEAVGGHAPGAASIKHAGP